MGMWCECELCSAGFSNAHTLRVFCLLRAMPRQVATFRQLRAGTAAARDRRAAHLGTEMCLQSLPSW